MLRFELAKSGRVFVAAVACALLVLTNGTLAQMAPHPGARTPAECLTIVQQYPAKQAEADRKAGRPVSYRTYQKQSQALGKECAEQFKVQDVSGSDLVTLAKLYLAADEKPLAREAVDRRLKTPGLSEVERAEALVSAIGVVLSGTPSEADVKQGEDYVAQTDALSNGPLKQKIAAHSRIVGWYSYSDIDAPNLAHHQTIIRLIDQLPAEERKAYATQRASAFDYIALVYGNRGQVDKALETLRQAKDEMNDPKLATMFDSTIERYSLVGQRVPPLKATYWLNAAGDAKQLDPAGRVTMIQFTAHWCGPCRKSYPAMLKMYEMFSKRGLDVVLATELYGYFEDRESLKPEDEVAADREYFIGKYNLPFKVLIEPRMNFADRTPAGEAARQEFNQFKYRVGGIPQIVILDKQGVVRHIMVGWDPANEELVTKELDRLLKEPDTKSK